MFSSNRHHIPRPITELAVRLNLHELGEIWREEERGWWEVEILPPSRTKVTEHEARNLMSVISLPLLTTLHCHSNL